MGPHCPRWPQAKLVLAEATPGSIAAAFGALRSLAL